jgi:O-acetyl-ADP-ribose deacetylase (regulator of RNase III)
MSDELPDGYPQFCAICGDHIDEGLHDVYANPVCRDCDSRAVSEPGVPAEESDNPVFIDGIRCFRRYRHGGWVSQRDALGCDDYTEFYERHYDDAGPIHTFNQPDPPTDGRDIRQRPPIEGTPGDGFTARIIEDDILNVDADALICGITTDPSLQGGVAGAVCDAAEHSLRPFIRAKAPLQLGDVVATGGFDLPYSYVVFVAATPAESGEGATEDSVQEAVQNGLQKVADLRLPAVALPLIGAGAGGLATQTAGAAIASGIQASAVSPPMCVRVVTRDSDDRDAIESEFPAQELPLVPPGGQTDPLCGKITAQLDRVDRSGDPSEWEVYPWLRFDPYSGAVSEHNASPNAEQTSLPPYGIPQNAKDLLEDTLDTFVDDVGYPEQLLARFDGFNSQMSGTRGGIDHAALAGPLYSYERSLVGALRGLEHDGSEFSDLFELALDTTHNEELSQTVARIRYQVPADPTATSDEVANSCLQTSLSILAYMIETLSHLDFDHPMSSTLETTPVDEIEIIAHAFSQVAFEVSIPMDLAEDFVYATPSPQALRETALCCENHLE